MDARPDDRIASITDLDLLNVLGMSGSLREGSYNTSLLRESCRLAPAGMAIEIVSLKDIPLYNADLESSGFPAAVTTLREKIRTADALLIATPEYNFSMPGVLKNTLDWISRPPSDLVTTGKPVAIMGAGGRLGTGRAQYHLRQVCGCLSMLPVPRPEVFVIGAWQKFSEDGRLTDPQIRKDVGELLLALAEWTRQLKAVAQSSSARVRTAS